MNIAYIQIENTTNHNYDEFIELAQTTPENFSNLEINIIDFTEYYFVLKLNYDDEDEIKELVSTISYLLINLQIFRFIVTVTM